MTNPRSGFIEPCPARPWQPALDWLPRSCCSASMRSRLRGRRGRGDGTPCAAARQRRGALLHGESVDDAAAGSCGRKCASQAGDRPGRAAWMLNAGAAADQRARAGCGVGNLGLDVLHDASRLAVAVVQMTGTLRREQPQDAHDAAIIRPEIMAQSEIQWASSTTNMPMLPWMSGRRLWRKAVLPRPRVKTIRTFPWLACSAASTWAQSSRFWLWMVAARIAQLLRRENLVAHERKQGLMSSVGPARHRAGFWPPGNRRRSCPSRCAGRPGAAGAGWPRGSMAFPLAVTEPGRRAEHLVQEGKCARPSPSCEGACGKGAVAGKENIAGAFPRLSFRCFPAHQWLMLADKQSSPEQTEILCVMTGEAAVAAGA